MVFSSLLFLFVYLPCALLIHRATPARWRYLALLLLSLAFYGWGEPIYILLMLFSIAVGFFHGKAIAWYKARGADKAARIALISSVVCNLLVLLFFKYWDFLAGSLAAVGLGFLPVLGLPLPIGISFYTFQTMSYTIDVYRGDADQQKNPAKFGMFVSLFPQLMAGPIIKYKELEGQLDAQTATAQRFAAGVPLFVIGLFKKVLLANALGTLWNACKAMDASGLTTGLAWLGLLAFTFQIYFDFSGYSDMAIALGRMVGFEFPINFNYPYAARSITEFWRRWHISLGSWFREYLYIPLGGNRVSMPRLCLNLLVVWALTGIWHGASWNFLLWGLYFAALLMLEKLWLGKLLERLPAAVARGYTFLLAMVSWAIFGLEDWGQLGAYLRVMFGLSGAGLGNGALEYYAAGYWPVLLVAAAASVPAAARLWHKLPPRVARAAMPVLIVCALLLCTAYLVDATYNPFLYFRF